jgi:magnesium-transporting ATPase (P-type)
LRFERLDVVDAIRAHTRLTRSAQGPRGSEGAAGAPGECEHVASASETRNFLLLMALCHSLVVESKDSVVAADATAPPKGAKKGLFGRRNKKSSKSEQNDNDSDVDKSTEMLAVADGKRALANSSTSVARADNDAAFNGEVPKYSASSPDEIALAAAAARNGFVFLGATQSAMTIGVRDNKDAWHREQYELLASIEFTSDRRRMSVIVRDSDKNVTLYWCVECLLCMWCEHAHCVRVQQGRRLHHHAPTATLDVAQSA